MPMYPGKEGKPVIQFDPRIEVSPFALFRWLRDGREISLVDVRPEAGERTLEGAGRREGDDWRPADGQEVVLFDDDGSAAVALAERLQAEGHERVKALFGGLDLYEFSLDPRVVGERTFLRRGQR